MKAIHFHAVPVTVGLHRSIPALICAHLRTSPVAHDAQIPSALRLSLCPRFGRRPFVEGGELRAECAGAYSA